MDYDPRFDPRRPRRPENEADDAWSAAEEDDLAEPDVEIEDLAAGYEWNDPDLLVQEPPLRRRSDSRPYIAAEPVERPGAPFTGGSYDPARGYRSLGPITSEPFDPFRPPTKPDMPAMPGEARPPLAPGCLSALPFWGIVVVVVLALVALAVLVLALASLRLLVG